MKKLLILMVMFISPIFSQEIKTTVFSSFDKEFLATRVEQFIAKNNISKSDIISVQYAIAVENNSTTYSVFLLYVAH